MTVQNAKNKKARLRGPFILASPGGFAYMPQAAESLASDSLLIPRVSRAGGLLVAAKTKSPLARAFYSGVPRGIRTPVLTVKG